MSNSGMVPLCLPCTLVLLRVSTYNFKCHEIYFKLVIHFWMPVKSSRSMPSPSKTYLKLWYRHKYLWRMNIEIGHHTILHNPSQYSLWRFLLEQHSPFPLLKAVIFLKPFLFAGFFCRMTIWNRAPLGGGRTWFWWRYLDGTVILNLLLYALEKAEPPLFCPGGINNAVPLPWSLFHRPKWPNEGPK